MSTLEIGAAGQAQWRRGQGENSSPLCHFELSPSASDPDPDCFTRSGTAALPRRSRCRGCFNRPKPSNPSQRYREFCAADCMPRHPWSINPCYYAKRETLCDGLGSCWGSSTVPRAPCSHRAGLAARAAGIEFTVGTSTCPYAEDDVKGVGSSHKRENVAIWQNRLYYLLCVLQVVQDPVLRKMLIFTPSNALIYIMYALRHSKKCPRQKKPSPDVYGR